MCRIGVGEARLIARLLTNMNFGRWLRGPGSGITIR
jgi:hypothetical protein